MARLLTAPSLFFFLLFVAVSHAASTLQEEYWHSVLPNTPIPNAIRDILNTGMNEKLHIDSGDGGIMTHIIRYNKAYKSSDDKIRYDPSITYFFKEEDLFRPGTKMNLGFPRSSYGINFLSRQDAKSIPFSSSRLPETFSRFSIDPNSALAKYMTSMLTDCEAPAAVGEKKLCATSLESMVDFSTSNLGTNQVNAFSTVVLSSNDGKDNEKAQLFSVAPNGIRKLSGDKMVSCHQQIYPYAVFYCHRYRGRGYVVELAGEDGMRVEAVATCHTNTEVWSPDHLAFKMLKVKPGEVPICHILPQKDLMWSRNN